MNNGRPFVGSVGDGVGVGVGAGVGGVGGGGRDGLEVGPHNQGRGCVTGGGVGGSVKRGSNSPIYNIKDQNEMIVQTSDQVPKLAKIDTTVTVRKPGGEHGLPD